MKVKEVESTKRRVYLKLEQKDLIEWGKGKEHDVMEA